MKPANGKNDTINFGKHEFTKEKLLYVLKMMLSARNVDNKAMNLLRQGKHFSYCGSRTRSCSTCNWFIT